MSDASIAAGLELARSNWGNEVTIHGSADFKERALRLAVERERARPQDREILRERSRDRGIERDGLDIGWSRLAL